MVYVCKSISKINKYGLKSIIKKGWDYEGCITGTFTTDTKVNFIYYSFACIIHSAKPTYLEKLPASS